MQIFESFWFECVTVWFGNLPTIIFSLFGQGISYSVEMYTWSQRLVYTCCLLLTVTALEDMPGPRVALAQKPMQNLEFLILQAVLGGLLGLAPANRYRVQGDSWVLLVLL